MTEQLVPIVRARWKGTWHPAPDPSGNRAQRREAIRVAKIAKRPKKVTKK